MSRAEEIRAEVQRLMAELEPLVDAEATAAARAIVGRCYKYENRWSLDERRWWLYALVVGVVDARPQAIQFQVTPEGTVEVERTTWSSTPAAGFVEISNGELLAAWADLTQYVVIRGHEIGTIATMVSTPTAKKS